MLLLLLLLLMLLLWPDAAFARFAPVLVTDTTGAVCLRRWAALPRPPPPPPPTDTDADADAGAGACAGVEDALDTTAQPWLLAA